MHTQGLTAKKLFVPVIGSDRKPLMPTTPGRARRWIESGKATPFWDHGVFCVRLNVEPSAKHKQEIAVGIDPGSKREGLTVKSTAHTFLNLHVEARTGVKESVESRRNMRKARRGRNTPCRKSRPNRKMGVLPPSTKARWQWKLNLSMWICRIFPISHFVVEDIKAYTKQGKPYWNRCFYPLEVGKKWFYEKLVNIAALSLKRGQETKGLREALGLKKSNSKLAELFESHCVDSWVLANSWTGGHTRPDNTVILCMAPLVFRRRSLHYLQPAKGGERGRHGGTISLGFKRGSIVEHPKYGIAHIGGTTKGRVSLHHLHTGIRLCQNAKPEEIRFCSYNSWRTWCPER